MKCILDRTPMELFGSRVTDDQREVVSIYCCPKCFRRVIQREQNPRYVPIAKETPSPVRTYNRHAKAQEP